MSEANGGTGENKVPTVEEMLANPEVQKAIQAKLDAEVTGLKNKNTELLDKMKKVQDTAKQFEGLDVVKLKGFQEQLEKNEELRLLSEGKYDDVFNKRFGTFKSDFETQLSARDKLVEESTKTAKELEKALKQKDRQLTELVVDSKVREAYITLDFEPTAMDDVMRAARDIFKVDEEGKVTPRDVEGKLILGKDGKTPITSKEWLESLVEKKPYLRRPSAGAGAQGGGKGGGVVDTSKMSSKELIAQGLKSGALGDFS